MDETDMQLVERYTRHHAEDDFAELARRHLGLVYSAALRQLRSPELAEEVAQSVFLDLARQAATLAHKTVLTAWLYKVTRRRAIDVVRRETRRQAREQIAYQLTTMNAVPGDWTQIEALLDEGMDALDESDRTLILLRYFENKSMREVGAALGTSENAAQKRLSRAVEHLHDFFTKRGVKVGASGLAGILSVNAIQAVPCGLNATITAMVTQAATINAITLTGLKATAMTTLQKAAITLTLIAAVSTGFYQTHRASLFKRQVQNLQELLPASEKLIRERDEAIRRLAALEAENERLTHNNSELQRLRA
ncbi:MAG: hypothetical protein JWM99_2589, partial [Verrucomicrobiales bacterium]|nr:hypothetical protein [Verrucomicrobiales bacterium]